MEAQPAEAVSETVAVIKDSPPVTNEHAPLGV